MPILFNTSSAIEVGNPHAVSLGVLAFTCNSLDSALVADQDQQHGNGIAAWLAGTDLLADNPPDIAIVAVTFT